MAAGRKITCGIAMADNSSKLAFIDAEFTGEHKYTTLVSLGIVGMGEEELYITFNEYDRRQVTPWLSENVLSHIDESKSMSYKEGFQRLSVWLQEFSNGEKVSFVSVGKTLDLVLLFQLWHHAFPEREYFHNLYCLPDCINHSAHYDFPTILWLCGLPTDMCREEYIGSTDLERHNALHDAKILRECFKRCVTKQSFPRMVWK